MSRRLPSSSSATNAYPKEREKKRRARKISYIKKKPKNQFLLKTIMYSYSAIHTLSSINEYTYVKKKINNISIGLCTEA